MRRHQHCCTGMHAHKISTNTVWSERRWKGEAYCKMKLDFLWRNTFKGSAKHFLTRQTSHHPREGKDVLLYGVHFLWTDYLISMHIIDLFFLLLLWERNHAHVLLPWFFGELARIKQGFQRGFFSVHSYLFVWQEWQPLLDRWDDDATNVKAGSKLFFGSIKCVIS